jgi:hypothetical protein
VHRVQSKELLATAIVLLQLAKKYTANALFVQANVAATQGVCCDTGYWSVADATACSPAPAGKFAALPNNAATTSCVTKTRDCAVGTWSDTLASSCTACGVGYTSPVATGGTNTGTACTRFAGYGRSSNTYSCVVACVSGSHKNLTTDSIYTTCKPGEYMNPLINT